MRILYVEDNATNVILVQRVANMGKHEVINYDDGQLALDNFDQLKPDLILLDIQLRGPLTGLDIARILREKGCKLPIIAVTAYAMKGDRQLCLDAGCDDYLPKPVSVTELVTVFKRYGDAVTAGKPILSSYKLTTVMPTPPVTPPPAVLAPVVEVLPVSAAAPVEAARPADSLPAVTPVPAPTPIPVPAVTVADPPAVTPPTDPVVQRAPAPVSAEP